MDELRVAAGVGELGDGEGELAGGGAVGGRVGERERDALVVVDAGAALLPRRRPGDGLVEQAPEGAAAARRDSEPLGREPAALEVLAATDPPMTSASASSTSVNKIVGWPSG